MIKKIGIVVAIFFSNLILAHAQVKSVNIDPRNFRVHFQNKTNWCWAASIQMILEYNDVFRSQNEIVFQTFCEHYDANGNIDLPNFTGSSENISNNLDGWNTDVLNRECEITSSFYRHAPSPSELVYYLSNNQPLLISYLSSPTMGHAIVLTGCKYIQQGDDIAIIEITCRDPWLSDDNKSNGGLKIYNENFYKNIRDYWIVNYRLKGTLYLTQKSITECKSEFCEKLTQVIKGFINSFVDLRGEPITDITYHGLIKFPGEVSNFVKCDTSPSWTTFFYKGTDADDAEKVFEDLKKQLSFEFGNVEVGTWGHSTIFERSYFFLDSDLIIELQLTKRSDYASVWMKIFRKSPAVLKLLSSH